MSVISSLVLKWLVPFICGAVVSFGGVIVGKWRNNQKRLEAMEAGVQCLLRAEIIRQYEKYEDKHYCPIYAKEALKREYDSYHALGGNDVATGLFNKTMALPEEPEHKEE